MDDLLDSPVSIQANQLRKLIEEEARLAGLRHLGPTSMWGVKGSEQSHAYIFAMTGMGQALLLEDIIARKVDAGFKVDFPISIVEVTEKRPGSSVW